MAVIGLYTFKSHHQPDEWHGIGLHRSWVDEDYDHLWHRVPEGYVGFSPDALGELRQRTKAAKEAIMQMGRTNGKGVDANFELYLP